VQKAKMAECRWLKPVLIAQVDFLEWTGENHLRHTKFIGLREDKAPKDVHRE
jgi:ATP-dependent DNA ligase